MQTPIEIKQKRDRIKEIDLITEPLLIEKELLRKEIIAYSNMCSNAEFLKSKFEEFAEKQKDIPVEFVEIINRDFWSLI